MILAINKIACILFAVFELERAFSVELVVAELPLVGLIEISEVVGAFAVKHVIHEVALVEGTVGPLLDTMYLFAIRVFAFELDVAHRVDLLTSAVLQIVQPLSIENGAVGIHVCSASTGESVLDLTLIHLAAIFGNAAEATHLSQRELAFVS